MNEERLRKDRIAQWAFDTRPILGRFHLWLEDVEETVLQGEGPFVAFTGGALARNFIVAAGVTALGTRLFGGWAEGRDAEKSRLNRVKKDADALSAYAMSEALWYLSRTLPENHALMVSLGEGLMPKAGETPEMGSNPLLGFGRVYARPEVARFVDHRVHLLLNDPDYGWDRFWSETEDAGIRIWGAAIDTLENTSRFAKGAPNGPMAVLHVFDQPLQVASPYEGYVGALVLPKQVARDAEAHSVFLSFRTPRRLVLAAIRRSWPDVPPERVHVWTLRGKSRERRLGALWKEWSDLGVHLVEDGWQIPGGGEVFTESGTYAPMNRIGAFLDDEGRRHVLICDGYAASAEAIQAASLDPIQETRSSLALFSSRFVLPCEEEQEAGLLDPEEEDFAVRLRDIATDGIEEEEIEAYRSSFREARDAGLPVGRRHLAIDDFLPRKSWRVLALAGAMLPDPWTGMPGVEEVAPSTYRVTVRAATKHHVREVALTLRLAESMDESRLVFSPLLDRFAGGEDWTQRAVKVSDSGRIRNELQTLCSQGIEYLSDDRMRIWFDRVDDAVLSAEKKAVLGDVLRWYKENHPIWFRWLDLP